MRSKGSQEYSLLIWRNWLLVDSTHKRVAGMHVTKSGDIALVWLAHDSTVDDVTVYDACIFKSEVPVVIAESINARGRWIPVAWAHEEMQQSLLDRGCRMLPEASSDSDEMAEIVSRDIWERMRTKRLHADKRLRNWFEEAKTLEKSDNKIPRDSHPLMAATRIAISQLRYARRQQPKSHRQKKNFVRMAIV